MMLAVGLGSAVAAAVIRPDWLALVVIGAFVVVAVVLETREKRRRRQ
jgi:hypothetical protein